MEATGPPWADGEDDASSGPSWAAKVSEVPLELGSLRCRAVRAPARSDD